jgi:hypothetical protein
LTRDKKVLAVVDTIFEMTAQPISITDGTLRLDLAEKPVFRTSPINFIQSKVTDSGEGASTLY